ncbi:3-methyl-2-oxobutanoate hydroxymethyltransferase [candidate division WOR-3 bacterium]|nr:3-methyl-2-oxobutanoate hydroxymethyltransferase [candidate division WOR-3 bacterium]
MVTTDTIRGMKGNEKIACLTAYDYPTAVILDRAGIDVILVGDSAANVVGGERTTLPISMEEMLYHTRVVSRAVANALVIADMPFLSYQTTEHDAVFNAGRFLKLGACGVKLEGGTPILSTIERLIALGIPVMGHLGLTPQSVHQFGGYKLQGSSEKDAKRMIEEAVSLQNAGIFALVLEKIPSRLARTITERLTIPTIGIGAGAYCDGQILVLHDILGMFDDFKPKFVKRYAEIGRDIMNAVLRYKDEVKQGTFPDLEHSFE